MLQQILFISANRIGDAVLTTGLLRHLVETRPDAEFTVACGPVTADLFRAVPRLKKLIPMKKMPHHGHWVKLWKECRGTNWDLIVDLRNSLASRFLRGRERIYGTAVRVGHHRVLDNAALMKLDPPPSPLIWTDEKAEAEAAALIGGASKILGIGPAANWPAKQWPCFNFAKLVLGLTAAGAPFEGAKILIAAAKPERKQIEPLFEMLPKDSLIEAIGPDLLTIAACLKRCAMFIGNDSGLTHISAAVGTPTLGLFGPSYDSVYAPWGPRAAPVRTDETPDELFARMDYAGEEYPNLMTGLSVAKAQEAALALWDRVNG
jgi:lipopolysaccharide export system permease protein